MGASMDGISPGRPIGPTLAERARTTLWLAPSLCVHAGTAHDAVDVHGSGPEGSLILVVPYSSALAAGVRRSHEPVGVVVDASARSSQQRICPGGQSLPSDTSPTCTKSAQPGICQPG